MVSKCNDRSKSSFHINFWFHSEFSFIYLYSIYMLYFMDVFYLLLWFRRNHCAYVVEKSVSFTVQDGVAPYVKAEYNKCSWGQKCPTLMWVGNDVLQKQVRVINSKLTFNHIRMNVENIHEHEGLSQGLRQYLRLHG